MNKKTKDMTLKQVLKMDVKSDDFFEAYKAISDKYWKFENPDDFQIAAHCLVMFAERFDRDKIILAVKIIKQIVEMSKKGAKSAKGHLAFKNQDYYFDIYESEVQKDTLENMLTKAGKAIESYRKL